jgi:deoxycytidine triphosphate deaminase
MVDDQVVPTGFLTDSQIEYYLSRGQLVVRNTWVRESVRHASYMIRLGNRVEVARASKANADERRDFVVQDLNSGDYLELNPGDTAKLFSLEHLVLPSDILAFTVARGLLFFESLVPENTYADPGFTGQLYVTVTNLSHRIIRLYYADPIARIFFFKLSATVAEPFVAGATKGVKQRLESTRATQVGTAEECRKADTQRIIEQLQHLPIGGTQFVELWIRQAHRTNNLLLFAIAWPPLLLVANLNKPIRDLAGSILSNVAAVVLSASVSLFAPWLWQKIRKL